MVTNGAENCFIERLLYPTARDSGSKANKKDSDSHNHSGCESMRVGF